MYRIDTGQARTDLSGIGKGAAQVLDLSPMREQAQLNQQERFAKQQQKSKEQQAREDDIMANLSASGNIAIMPKDRELIAGKSQAVRDYVVQNIDKLKNGDAASTMQFQNLYGDLKTSAEMSKNFREAWEQRGLALQKDPNAYREGVLDQHLNRASTADAGNWNIDDSIYKKNINYNDRVIGDLAGYAQKAATDTPYGKTFNRKQADEVIASDLENPEMFDQAAYDYSKAKDKMGATDPVSYYQRKYAPKLVINDTKAPPEYYVNGGANKAPKVSGTYVKNKDGKDTFQFEYTNTQDNPYITIPDPNNRNNAIEVKPYKVEFGGKYPLLRVLTKPTGEGDNKKEGKEMSLDYNYVSDIMNNKFGIKNVYDLQDEKSTPSHVTVKRTDASANNESKGHGSNSPTKGDERAVKGGTAVYDGTKWVMKK